MFDIRSEGKECIIVTNHKIKQDSDSDDTCDSSKLRVKEEDEETEQHQEEDAQNGSKSLTSELNNDQSSSSIQCDILNEVTPTLNGKITIQRIDSEPLNSPNGEFYLFIYISNI